jgi:hypothetical protein
MNRAFFIFISLFFTLFSEVLAVQVRPATAAEKNTSSMKGFFDGVVFIIENIVNILAFVLIAWISLKILRLGYEILMSGRTDLYEGYASSCWLKTR